MSNLVAIVATEARSHVNPDDPLEDRFRAAFTASHDHWMVLDERQQMQGAIAAVLDSATDEERERITAELEVIRDTTALLTGVPVDVNVVLAKQDAIPGGLIGILKMWKETA